MVVSKGVVPDTARRAFGPIELIRGLAKAIRRRVDVAALEILRLFYGFERWHARSPDSTRPYRKQVASLVSGLAPKYVVEYGCGLGGIISRVKAQHRYGIDRDSRVIQAAHILRPTVHFSQDDVDRLGLGHVDVVIAVNWLHDLSPEELERWLTPLLPKMRYLVVDAVHPGTEGYSYHHDFKFLGKHGRSISISALGERSRSFMLWEISH